MKPSQLLKPVFVLLLVLLSVLMLTSCKKATFERKVRITVKDEVYGLPVPDVDIKVWQYDDGEFWQGCDQVEGVTGVDGKCELEWKPCKDRDIILKGTILPKIIYLEDSIETWLLSSEYVDLILGGKSFKTIGWNEVEMIGIPLAKLRVLTFDNFPFNENDRIGIIVGGYNIDHSGTGDGIFEVKIPANENTIIRWYVGKNGESTEYCDTVNVGFGESLEYTITY